MPGPVPLHPFRPRLLDALQGYDRGRFARDLGAGLTVGIVALPLALAFGIASGLEPTQGLITAIVAGFLISALGGSQVQIGGPAGAFIVIVYGIVDKHGLTGLLVSTFAAGALMLAMGLLRLGVLIRYIPVSIVIGFTNGIAVLIALSQLRDALGLPIARMPAEFFAQLATLGRHLGQVNPAAAGLTAGGLLLLALWPRLGARWPLLARVPGAIVVMVLATVLVALLQLPVETIGSRFGELPLGLPQLELPPLSWDRLQQLTIPIVTIALLGAVESLLCARVADGLGEHRRHDPNQELMAQGVANMVTPFFGGMPATGTIARTVTNVRAGAATPVAGMVHAAVLLIVLLVAAPLASHVPLAALSAILLFVAWNMFEGHQFRRLRQFAPTYRTLMLTTFVLTVVFDLTVAVEVGLVLACLFFIWRMGQLFSATPRPASADAPLPEGVAVIELYGALFFGAVGKIEALPEQLPAGTRALVLDMQRLVSMDTTGLDALEQLWRTLQRRPVALVLANVNPQPLSLIRRSGFEALIGAEHIVQSLDEALRAPPG
ncbi:MAG: SulP family inorganic anion transporter [Burkholderiaceae bacterium]|jgi:SulP family sulfate permease|nr:STAS domain-containing protein [Burkholderiaceae bacterium]MCZ8176781.1 SulP family inorganic anion transporter [Burkholderiaceae bacterium]